MRKLTLVIAALMVLLCAAQVVADVMDVVFSDSFENYAANGAALDKNLASDANAAPNGSGNPWFGPAPPNARVVGAENGIMPHTGNKMIRGNAPSEFDENWVNIAYRFNGGAVYKGNITFDFWFYDQLGANGTAMKDYAALGYYNTAPTNTDYPGTGSLNGSGTIQRLSLGAYGVGDPNLYQARVVGAGDGISGAPTWFNTTTPRTVGWHHGRVAVGPLLSDNTNDVKFFIDDMDKPTLQHNSMMKTGYNVIEVNTYDGATTAYYDDISLSVLHSYPDSGQCADVRNTNDGDYIVLKSKRVTAVAGGGIPADYCYVEDANRAGAILVHMTNLAAQNIGIGDNVTVTGRTAIANGEKYIEASSISGISYPRALDAVVMSSKAANDKASKGLFVKMTGKVLPKSAGGDESFILDDGGAAVKVYCGTIPVPTYANARVRGVLSTSGSKATLLVGDALDIADANATVQPLPLPGAKKYFRDYLIIGPFTNSSITGATDQEHADNLMNTDFLGAESSDHYTLDISPAIGDTVSYNGNTYKWQRWNGSSDIIDFNAVYGNGAYKDWAVGYAVVYIYSPLPYIWTSDMTLGSDDELRVYANTNKIFEDLSLQGVGYSKKSNVNSNAGFDLAPGLNTFVFKLVNGTGEFKFVANIIEQGTFISPSTGWGDGSPVAGLGYYPNKPQ